MSDDLKGYEWVVYAYADPDLYLKDSTGPDIDDVIAAGIKALDCEAMFQFAEADLRDAGHF